MEPERRPDSLRSDTDRRDERQTRRDYAPPVRDPQRKSRGRAVVYGLAFLAALAALIALLTADGLTVEPTSAMGTASIDDIIDDPELYDGRVVTVVGEVDDPHAALTAFVLEDEDLFFDDELVVINDTGEPLSLIDDTEWQATGTLEVYDGLVLDAAPGLDDTTLDLDVGDPVLVATSVGALPPPTVGW